MPSEAASLFVTLGARTTEFTRSMNAAEARMKAAAANMNASAAQAGAGAASGASQVSREWNGAANQVESRWKRTASSMRTTGAAMTRSITVPLALIGGVAVKMATDYEKSVNKIATLSSGSAKDIAMLRNEVLKLGGETAKSPVELANALYIIESGGLKGKEAMAILAATAKASAVGLGDAAVLARAVTGAYNAYTGAGYSAERVTNALAKAIKLGMVPTEELAGSIGKLTSVSGFMQVSLESTLGALAAMTRTGLDASVAANQLRMVLIGFQKPSDKAAAALQSVGLSAADVRKSLSTVGFQGTMEMLWKAAGKGAKNVDEQKAKYVEFFNAIARGGAAALIAVGNNMQQNKDIAKQMGSQVDVVGASFERLRKQPGFQMQAAFQQVKNDLIILGEVLLPLIAPALVAIANGIQKVLEKFKGLPKPVQTVLIAIGGIALVLGPVLSMIGTMGAAVSGFIAIAGALGIGAAALLGWVAVAGVVIAALVAGAILIVNNWDAVSKFFTQLWSDIQAQAQPVIEWLKTAWADASQWVTNAFGNVSNAVSTAFSAVSGVISSIGSTISGIASSIANTFGPLVTAVGGVGGVFSALGDLISAVASKVATGVRMIAQPVIFLVTSIANAIGAVLGPALGYIANAFSTAFSVAKAMITPVITAVGALANIVSSVLVAGFTTAWGAIKPIVNGIASIVTGAFNIIKGAIKVLTGILTLDFGKAWEGVKNIFSGGIKIVVSYLTAAYGTFKAIGTTLMNMFVAGIKAVWNGIKSVIDSILDSMVKVIRDMFNGFYNAGRFILNALGSGIKSVFNSIIGAMKGFITLLLSPINFVLKAIGAGQINPFGGGGGPRQANASEVNAATGVGRYAVGGVVNRPSYIAGEEAPSHPEVILATNPRYRQRNLQLWSQAGSMLGVPGYAMGGVNGKPYSGGVVGDILGTAGNLALTAISPMMGAFLDVMTGGSPLAMLPKPPDLPNFIQRLPQFLIEKTANWIKSKATDLFSTGGMGAMPIAGGVIGAMAKHLGLSMTSHTRPNDKGSYHAIGRAWDYSNGVATKQELAFAKWLASTFGSHLLELIHTPLGFSIKNGKRTAPYATAEHYNHVHVAYSKGGIFEGVPNFWQGGQFLATAYGPPWNKMNGTGTTATGINLGSGIHRYIVAVDPHRIPMHSTMKITPNPFNYSGTFGAEDTGGAIKGNRVDFYDWRGRSSQYAWGRRMVNVTPSGATRGDTTSQAEAQKKFLPMPKKVKKLPKGSPIKIPKPVTKQWVKGAKPNNMLGDVESNTSRWKDYFRSFDHRSMHKMIRWIGQKTAWDIPKFDEDMLIKTADWAKLDGSSWSDFIEIPEPFTRPIYSGMPQGPQEEVQPPAFVKWDVVNPFRARIQEWLAAYEMKLGWIKMIIAQAGLIDSQIREAVAAYQKEIRRLQELVKKMVNEVLRDLVSQYNTELKKDHPDQSILSNLKNMIGQFRDLNKTIGGSPDSVGNGGWIGTLIKSAGILTNDYQEGWLAPLLTDMMGYGQGGKRSDTEKIIRDLRTDLVYLDPEYFESKMMEIPNAKGYVKPVGDYDYAFPNLGGGAATTSTPSSVTDLLKTQTEAARAAQLMSQTSTSLINNFLASQQAQRWPEYLGSFATGTPSLPSTGMFFGHKGEAIIPASLNPYTNNVTSGSPTVVVAIADGSEYLKDLIEVTIDGKKAEIVEEVNGNLGFTVGMRRGTPGAPGRGARY